MAIRRLVVIVVVWVPLIGDSKIYIAECRVVSWSMYIGDAETIPIKGGENVELAWKSQCQYAFIINNAPRNYAYYP